MNHDVFPFFCDNKNHSNNGTMYRRVENDQDRTDNDCAQYRCLRRVEKDTISERD